MESESEDTELSESPDSEVVNGKAHDSLVEQNKNVAQDRAGLWKQRMSAALHLANSTIGAGVLSLPYVASRVGVVASLLALTAVAALTTVTLLLLLRCSEVVVRSSSGSGSSVNIDGNSDIKLSYELLGERALGRVGVWTVGVGSILINFGAVLSYTMMYEAPFTNYSQGAKLRLPLELDVDPW
jgi:hypothetical protein